LKRLFQKISSYSGKDKENQHLIVLSYFCHKQYCILILQRFRTLFLKDPSKPLFWIVLGLLVKGLPFLFLLHSRPADSDIPGIWAGTFGDSHGYLDPIDNLLKNGSYSPEYRMPGYGFIYLLFRCFLPFDYSCNILIILQFILAGISVYYLALIAKTVFKSDKIFYVCFYLFLFSTYSNYFDGWIMTESFCNSALIFSVWFFVNYFQSAKVKNLLFSGMFLTWAVFLRPVFLPLFFVFILIVLVNTPLSTLNATGRWKKISLNLLFLIIPFLITEGSWVIRNYNKHQKMVFLLGSPHPWAKTFYRFSLFNFINSWGGNYDLNDNAAPFHWFGYGKQLSKIPYHDSLPTYIYTSQFNKDSLLLVKNRIIALNDSVLTPDENYKYQNEVKEKLDRYTLSIKEEKPVLYYIEAPFFHSLPNLLFGPGSKMYLKRYNLPGKMRYISEIFFTLFYYIVTVFGAIGAFIILFQYFRKNNIALTIAFLPLYTIIIHGIFFRYTENRYLMPAWAFLILCTSYFIVLLSKRKRA